MNPFALNSAVCEARCGCALINVATLELRDDGTQIVELVPKGDHPHRLGVQVVDAAALERLRDDMLARGADITIDYNHGSFKSLKDDEAKAAGWIKPETVTVTPNGLTAEIQWTQRAAEYIRNKEYRYLSPVLLFDPDRTEDGRLFITKLANAGLTNNPNIDAMEPLSNTKTEDHEMDLKQIAKKLGLPESATENDVLSKIDEMNTAATNTGEQLKTLLNSLDAADVDAASKKVMELTKPPAQTDGDNEAMQKRLRQLEAESAEALVNSAIKAGKVTANQKEWAQKFALNDRAAFEKWLEGAPVVLPTGDAQAEADAKTGGGPTALDLSMNNQFSSINKDDLAAVN